MNAQILIKNVSFQLVLVCFILCKQCRAKYLEGELHTNDNWAFLARFCFLSENGQFKYQLEFNEEQGYPNLLLYYDTEDQWPSVYKTNKECYTKESVLKMDQNQIINLTVTSQYHRDFSGCMAVERHRSLLPKETTLSPSTTQKFQKSTKIYIQNKKRHMESTHSTYSTPTYSSYVTGFSSISENITESFLVANSTPELFEGDENVYYHDEQEDVENIFENADLNGTELLQDYFTTEFVPIRKRSVLSKPLPTQPSMNRLIICENSRRFKSSRERWWFIAVSNCNGNKGIHIKYRMLMTNGPPNDYWHEHFSADEFYVLPVLLTFSIAYSFLFLSVIVCTLELKYRQLLHSTYKLFVLSVVIQFFGVGFKTMAYLKYSFNGIGAPKLKMFGEMLMGCSETCFLLLLILLAKGYTVTRGRLSLGSGVKLTVFMCLYSITYICLFIYQEKVFDPGEVLYLYESPAGYGLILLRVFAWLMFIYSTIVTLKHYPEKSNFYYPFNIFGTFWFVAGPAFILSANTYIDKWVRESVVNAVLLFITFGGHLMFLVLTMPSRANKNFPYHVRTTQIDIMETTGASTIEHFSHHPYEPVIDPAEQTVIIPLTKRTEELLGDIYAQKINNTSMRSINKPNNSNNLENAVDRDTEIVPDICMQNVLSWAIAKDCSVVAVPTFEKVGQRDSFRSTYSGERENGSSYAVSDFRSQKQQNTAINDFSDYIRDVPVELFTVSRMVVNMDQSNKISNH